jgi:hypothetical protein
MKATRPPVSWPQSLESESGPKISKSSSAFDLDLAADAQHLANLFLDQRLVLGVVVLDADPHVLVFRVQVVEGAQREEDGVVVGVLAAAEGLLALVEHADHGVEAAFDGDFLADGRARCRRAPPRCRGRARRRARRAGLPRR